MSKGVTLDYETADRITIDVLKDHANMLKEDLRAHVEEGKYLHEEDVVYYKAYIIPALDTVIKYFGGTL